MTTGHWIYHKHITLPCLIWFYIPRRNCLNLFLPRYIDFCQTWSWNQDADQTTRYRLFWVLTCCEVFKKYYTPLTGILSCASLILYLKKTQNQDLITRDDCRHMPCEFFFIWWQEILLQDMIWLIGFQEMWQTEWHKQSLFVKIACLTVTDGSAF